MTTVRLFGGVAYLAGREQFETDAATWADAQTELLTTYSDQQPQALAEALRHCSVLSDGIRITDGATSITGTTTLDVLPPFAGG